MSDIRIYVNGEEVDQLNIGELLPGVHHLVVTFDGEGPRTLEFTMPGAR